MDVVEVNLSQSFAKKLGMRTTAKKLFDDLDNETNVILDFSDVEFMSRSFAQEYVFQKHNSDLHIVERNMSEFIHGLLDVVEDDFKESCL